MRLNKTLFLSLLLSSISLFFSPSSEAINFPDKPVASIYYVDNANLISDDDRSQINSMGSSLLEQNHVPIMVVTIRSLAEENAADLTIEQYTQRLSNHWALQQNNHSILLLVSNGDHQVRIELGQGWESKYEMVTDKIMQEEIIPEFKEGHFSLGIMTGVESLASMARSGSSPAQPIKPAEHARTLPWLLLIFAVIFIVVTFVLRRPRPHRYWKFSNDDKPKQP